MNKVTITITESDVTENWMVKEGNIHIQAEFDPPIKKGEDVPMTHSAAMKAINAIVDAGEGEPIVTTSPHPSI